MRKLWLYRNWLLGTGTTKKFGNINILCSRNFVVKSKFKDVEIPNEDVTSFILKQIENYGERICFEEALSGRFYTFKDVINKVRDFSNGLQHLNFQEGDVISLALPNSIDYPVAVLGGADAGCIISPVNPNSTHLELQKVLENNDSRLILTDIGNRSKVLQVAENVDDLKVMVMDGEDRERLHEANDYLTFSKVCEQDSKPKKVSVWSKNGDSMFLLPFSSGTTGRPKGVMLTHRNFVANIKQIEPYGLCRGVTSSVLVMPMFHSAGMKAWMECMYHGVKTVILPTFDPDLYLNSLIKYQPEWLMLAPPLVQFLANSEKVQKKHLAKLRMVVVGAAPVGETIIKDFMKKVPSGCEIRETWGMTELAASGTLADTESVKGSCGQVVPNSKIKVIDLVSGLSLGPGRENFGEICYKGPQVMKGYWKNESETEMVLKNGWLHTGDIGFHDTEGNIFIIDRLKDLIKVKGYQVAPAELEDVIRGIPEVIDVAVIGIPDERNGEVPKAFIVTESGSLNAQHIEHFVEEKLSNYKKLRGGVEFVKSIPKTPSGKILKKDLKLLEDTNRQQSKG